MVVCFGGEKIRVRASDFITGKFTRQAAWQILRARRGLIFDRIREQLGIVPVKIERDYRRGEKQLGLPVEEYRKRGIASAQVYVQQIVDAYVPEKEMRCSHGKDVPGFKIEFADNVELGSGVLPADRVAIYRAVDEKAFEITRKHGFQAVPLEAVEAKNWTNEFFDDLLLHEGRLACAGNFQSAYDNRWHQGTGTIMRISIPARTLLENNVLLLDRDAVHYFLKILRNKGEKVIDQLPRNRDGDVYVPYQEPYLPTAEELKSACQTVSDKNKEVLLRLMEGYPGSIGKFILDLYEIIIPHFLLNPFLRYVEEIPIHKDPNYFFCDTFKGHDELMYIPCFWDRVLTKLEGIVPESALYNFVGSRSFTPGGRECYVLCENEHYQLALIDWGGKIEIAIFNKNEMEAGIRGWARSPGAKKIDFLRQGNVGIQRTCSEFNAPYKTTITEKSEILKEVSQIPDNPLREEFAMIADYLRQL